MHMNILVCGANGFIGRHLCAALTKAGHHVVRGVRTAGAADEIAIDYARDTRPEPWLPRLDGIDVVINAVGILSESAGATFDAIHRDTPVALFHACVQAGVRRVIQISALGGTNGRAATPYLQTKRAADAALASLPLEWGILRPSLVVGADGASSRLFRTLASLPVIGLPGRGDQRLQPVHIDDLAQAVVALAAPGAPAGCIVDVVGPTQMTYRSMFVTYRESMAIGSALWLPIPMAVMYGTAALAARLPQRVFAPDTLRMLEAGNVADAAPLTRLLGRPPMPPDTWFAGIEPGMLRADAVAQWMMPMFRIVLALIWIVTAALSFGLYPVSDSLAMLARVGLHGAPATAALYGAAALDLALGIATLLAPGRLLWRMQILLIAGYTAIITLFLPDYWLHPFGPVLKNLSILAILIALDAQSGRSRRPFHP
jgi:uncharacterized protein YbjT (DUF2867 family)